MKFRLLLLATLFAAGAPISSETDSQLDIGRLGEKARFFAARKDGKWGLEVSGAGSASAAQPTPVAFEFLIGDEVSHASAGYDRIEPSP
ncbi:MAG: hypothetical protein JOZ14_09680, partial [Acidobacteria bacterium]|nr:hypothetical protein [Acidobacteriota bacterium]